MLDPLQYYFRVLCNGMKMRFRMVMIAHPGPGIGFHKQFMWQIIILPTMYRPWYTEQEHLMSVMLYWLGGAWVVEFAHAALSMPGLATTQQHCMTAILASPAFPMLDELTSNILTPYKINAPSSNQVNGLVCMIHEIKVEERLDWCPCTNSILGLC